MRSASLPCLVTSKGEALETYMIGGWVDSRAGLDDMEKLTFLTLSGLGNSDLLVVQPVASVFEAMPPFLLHLSPSETMYFSFRRSALANAYDFTAKQCGWYSLPRKE
jgi:hypothetical protein